MKNHNAFIFIDANQYLDLYRISKVKKVLESIQEQQDYIFVSPQVVAEVQRNKLSVSARFLTEQFNQLKAWPSMAEYLLDRSVDLKITLEKKLQGISERMEKVRTDELENAVIQTLQRISLSEDKVSKALAVLFSKATTPTTEETHRARERKERGNPPGKGKDPLGDQLTWEQLLSYSKGKSKIWIISRDSDYYTEHQKKKFLNPFLYEDLMRLNQQPPELFWSDSIGNGIRDFVLRTRVKAKRLLTSEESQEIKKAQDALPLFDWQIQNDATDLAIHIARIRQRHYAAIIASMANQGSNPGMESDSERP